jgi:hypothetical protein
MPVAIMGHTAGATHAMCSYRAVAALCGCVDGIQVQKVRAVSQSESGVVWI